jgi:hypothetical protein
MAYCVVHHFKGGTQERYDALAPIVYPPDGSLLPGELFEAAGASEDGWVVITVFDSKERWDNFLNEKLVPAIGQVGDRGFAGPPDEWAFEAIIVKR